MNAPFSNIRSDPHLPTHTIMAPRYCRPTSLAEPGFIAALVTWTAVIAMVWFNQSDSGILLSGNAARMLSLGMALLFMILVVLTTIVVDVWPSPVQLAMVALKGVCAFVITAATPSSAGPILLIIVMSEIAARLPMRQVWPVYFFTNLLLLLLLSRVWGWVGAWIGTFSYGGFQLFAIIVMQYAVRAEQTSAELKEVNAHLLATRSLLAESARDQERLRIARELHDVAGHKLTALKLQLTALSRRPALAEDESTQLAAQLADELLGDLRQVVKQMREQDGMNLRAAIEQLAAPFPKPKVILELDDAARVDSVVKADAIVRAVQEALTNAARHGQAEHLWIRLKREQDRIEIELCDDGRGAGTPVPGSGLLGMQERFHEVGGDVALSAEPGRGFRILAWVPAL
ncbi:sensor histidine kinase [Ahniella affigens]|uniref:sensor histidine kinase n=1 Tax=Ahniella affigens TaxID=2021234 RepID=UPI0011B286DA|nr:sensor histidine kinase [Ahniella affigens]